MQYLAAYALISLSGKAPNKESLEAVLKASGAQVDAAQIDAVLKSLGGKKIEEVQYKLSQVITKGLAKVGSCGSGSAPAAKKEDKKEDKKEKEAKPPAQKPKEKEPEPEPEEEYGAGDLFG